MSGGDIKCSLIFLSYRISPEKESGFPDFLYFLPILLITTDSDLASLRLTREVTQ